MTGFICIYPFNKITYLGSVFPVATSRKPSRIHHLHLLRSDPSPDGTTRAPKRCRSPKTTRGSISTWKPSTRADSCRASCRRGVRPAPVPPQRWAPELGVYWRECVKTEAPFSDPPPPPPPPQWDPRAPPERASWRSSRSRSRRSASIWKPLWLVGRSFRLHWLKNAQPQSSPCPLRRLRPQSQPPFAPPSPKSQQIWKGDAHTDWSEHIWQ